MNFLSPNQLASVVLLTQQVHCIFFWLHKMHFWLIYDRCKTSAYKCLITHFVYEVNSRNTPKCCHFQPLYVQSMFFSCFTKHRNLIWKKKKKNLIHQKFGINAALMKFTNYDKFILIDGDSANIFCWKFIQGFDLRLVQHKNTIELIFWIHKTRFLSFMYTTVKLILALWIQTI